MKEGEKKGINIEEVGHLFLSGQARPGKSPSGKSMGTPDTGQSRGPCAIAICSAKEDVGRSIFCVNLAMELARQGRGTTLFPQLSIAPNAITLLGLEDLFPSNGGNGIRSIEGPFGVSLFLAGRDAPVPLRHLRSQTLKALEELTQNSSFLLLEIPDSITKRDTPLFQVTNEVILLVSPDPASMEGAFRQLKAIVEMKPELPVWIVANGVDSVMDGELIYREMEDLSVEFLDKRLEFLGYLYKDLRYYLACLDEPTALMRGRFSRTRKCMYEIVELLGIMEDLTSRTSSPRPSLSKRM
jgi:flagellar biosynthesis protein FlhG